jgi:HAD superfamily hydrolase (TIGR01509 family)
VIEGLKAVLWDMDGVLVDTGHFHFQAWMDVLPEYNIPFTFEKFRTTFGMNNTGLLTKLIGHEIDPELIDQISQSKESRFRKIVRGKIGLLPGVIDWLNEFHDMGIKQAVASSAPQANIDLILDELEIESYFSVAISAENMPGKPDPQIFLHTAELIGIEPKFCLIIEDSIAGVEAARKASIKCLAVTTSNPRSDLLSADMIVDSLEEIQPSSIKYLF